MDNFLFIGGGDGRVKKLDLISGKWNLTHEAQLEGKVTSLSLSTDQKELVAGTSTDRKDEQHPVAKIEKGPIKMTAVAVSPSRK